MDVQRLGRSMGLRITSANMMGAGMVFGLLELTLGPGHAAKRFSIFSDVALFGAALAVGFVLANWWGRRTFLRAVAWVDDGRAPERDERDALLRLPRTWTALSFTIWTVGAVTYFVVSLAAKNDLGHSIRIATGIVLGGLVTCGLVFLLVEPPLRPLFALALQGSSAGTVRSLSLRSRLLVFWALGSGVPLVALVAGPVLHEHGARVSLGASVALVALVGVGAGLRAMWLAARSLTGPIDAVRAAVERVEDGDLQVEIPVDHSGEIGLLESGVNRMVAGLRERERLQELFGRHVGVEVARQALVEGSGLGGEQREATALFVDLVGSTAMAEVMPPIDVVATLNAFFSAVVDVVGAEGGWVNKFQGDGALCVFGAPTTQTDHAARALRAARALIAELGRLGASHPGVDAAVGVSSGPLVAGNVGTEQRYEYTVVGRPVNEAARLTEMAKGRVGRALASAGAVERAGDEAGRWAPLGTVALRGQSTPTAIYEPAVPMEVRAS